MTNPYTSTPARTTTHGSILCINGSDSMGHSGLQADIRTVRDLGGSSVTVVTSVTMQNSRGISHIHELSPGLVIGQVRAVYEELHPAAVKVGMVNNAETIMQLHHEIVGCRNIVCSPVILSSSGARLMDDDAIHAYVRHLLPICRLLIIKCVDAEIVLGHAISTDADMRFAAREFHQMGAEWVLLRGGVYAKGRINALLSPPDAAQSQFFSSVNVEGWQRHGVGGTLSTAVATRLAYGDDVAGAISHAHSYLHSQVVYTSAHPSSLQPHNLYNRFMSLLSDNYSTSHSVAYYAKQLSISTRYLSHITNTVSGSSPKQVIDSYLLQKGEQLLASTTLTIQQVSDLLGFSSQATFAKFFQAKKNLTPTAYRAGG